VDHLVSADGATAGFVQPLTPCENEAAPAALRRLGRQSAALTVQRALEVADDVLLGDADLGRGQEGGGSILRISGCQDNQLSQDGEVNGLFTGELLQVGPALGGRRPHSGGNAP
jgi:hypothetical protein